MELQEYDNTGLEDQQAANNSDNKISLEKKSYSKIKIALAIVVVLATSIVGYLFYQHTKTVKIDEEKQVDEKQQKKVVYYDMVPIVVNLYTNNEKSKFLKIAISLVLKDTKSLEIVKELEPTIRDTYFVYLRQLRPSDVSGPIAIYRLKEALLKRTNKAIYPASVEDLLFHEMLVQ